VSRTLARPSGDSAAENNHYTTDSTPLVSRSCFISYSYGLGIIGETRITVV